MRIFVTGGTGFIGSRFVARLRAAGADHELLGLARGDRSAARLAAMGVRPIRGDLTRRESLVAALHGQAVDVVVHLAAETALQRSARAIEAADHVGTRNLLEAVEAASPPIARMIFTSTVVTGDARGRMLTEEDPLPVETAYGRAKKAGEDLLLAAGERGSVRAVILRPSHVYGPGGWFLAAVRDMRRGLFMIPGSGENLWDVIHVDDVAAALELLLSASEPREIYHAVDDTPVSMKDFFNEAARLLGRRPLRHVPVLLAKLIRGRGPIDAGIRSARSSNARLKGLGWRPGHPEYREGLASAIGEIAEAEGWSLRKEMSP